MYIKTRYYIKLSEDGVFENSICPNKKIILFYMKKAERFEAFLNYLTNDGQICLTDFKYNSSFGITSKNKLE